jgi:hypothetical protein
MEDRSRFIVPDAVFLFATLLRELTFSAYGYRR